LSPSILFGEDGLKAFVQQELHPEICPTCSPRVTSQHHFHNSLLDLQAKYRLTDSEISNVRVAGPGCQACSGNSEPGYRRGRTVCASILTGTEAIRDALVNNPPERRIYSARAAFAASRNAKFSEPDMTGKTVLQHMVYKVLRGNIGLDYMIKAEGAIKDHKVSFKDAQ
jgi:type II secretory ATPase GspE/PulE/Tfp pilus assembly ATPase PilB-like protein